MFGIAGAVHGDARHGRFDPAQIVREFTSAAASLSSRRRSFVARGIGTIHGCLREQPCEGDLCRRPAFLSSDQRQQIDNGLIRVPVLRREAGNDVAEVAASER